MKSRIRQIVSLLLLVVFLIPSTGMMLYVHHCNMSNSTVYDTERPSSCCGDGGCAVNSHSPEGDFTAVSATPCCDNSQLFIKLGLHLLSQTVKVLTADYPVIISGVAQVLWSDVPVKDEIRADNLLLYPPGELPFIMHSSLRL